MFVYFQGLTSLELILPHPETDYEDGMQVVRRIFVACFDSVEENREIAEKCASLLYYKNIFF